MGVRVAPADMPPLAGACQVPYAEMMSWRRLLCFPDRQLEAEFMEELSKAKRPGTLLVIASAIGVYIFEFFMVEGYRWVGDDSPTSRLLLFSRMTALLLALALFALTWLKWLNIEVASVLIGVCVSMSLVVGNNYRAVQLVGADDDHEWGCCFGLVEEAFFVLCFISSVTVMISFCAIRASRSCIKALLSIVIYLGSNGIGPLPSSELVKLGGSYIVLIFIFWSRTYALERDDRRRWLDNRRLRLEVQRQRVLYEEQQRWLVEVNERLEALQFPMQSSPVIAAPTAANTIAEPEKTVPAPTRPPPMQPVSALEPNELLARHMTGRSADPGRLRQMASQIRDPSYGVRDFFRDCIATFPELDLFLVSECSSGRDGLVEYQRTFGALFAVYWLLRLDVDGKLGLSFGYDEDWHVLNAPAGTDSEKKQEFFNNMDWSLLQEVTDAAVGDCMERVEAMLCLTAFHDIMKMSALCPHVSQEHAPYQDYRAGDAIHDHDVALAYVLEHYPHLIPSFSILPKRYQEVVLFTQSRMCFNHGWFVQAEGTPGAMLSKLKHVLQWASGNDLAFYFFHWLTDLSGAEGRPLAGAEKLTRRFPRIVLVSFLWSMPYLQHLADKLETEVVESYLEARFRQAFAEEPLPEGDGAVAKLRLGVMAQRCARLAVDAFGQAPEPVRRVLSQEMALTGIEGQRFRRSPVAGGPAFLVYYGPALLQRCKSLSEMRDALAAMAAVYNAGRRLWPRGAQRSGQTVTLEVGKLMVMDIGKAIEGSVSDRPSVWVLRRLNDVEARLELLSAVDINDLVRHGVAFVCVDLQFDGGEEPDEFSEHVPSSCPSLVSPLPHPPTPVVVFPPAVHKGF